MALTKSVEKFGSTFASAYHRITNVDYYVNEYEYVQMVEQAPDADGNPTPPVEETVLHVDKKANVTVKSYVDADARTALAEPLASKVYSFEPDWTSSDNLLAQAYAHLKTLEEFDGAVDA